MIQRRHQSAPHTHTQTHADIWYKPAKLPSKFHYARNLTYFALYRGIKRNNSKDLMASLQTTVTVRALSHALKQPMQIYITAAELHLVGQYVHHTDAYHRLTKYSLDNLHPIRTAEAFEAVDWLHQQTWLHCWIA